MNYILKILLSAIVVVVLSQVLPGVYVDTYWTAVIVAVVLSILNVLVKPVLILFTLPVTIMTLGLFLLIINALIIILADKLIRGFDVDGLLWALIFSLLLSLFQSVLYSLLKEDKKH
ncbi:phage holin family protein [Leptobacterium flavescens]|uniref:Phage holin family protein n=1 Tax=Leptobacterium flavescens TaxID=472055 RepID=A0A6P0UH48_9FLAO|nr:phage holin family protein [Leptobacterium flavescens]NER12585.1 phage holin family protein [Leptobacterium flavescens]